jgi:hypothetical protein
VVTCEELEELAGALALDAALPEEVADAREHLRTCTRAHDAVRELTATATVLALAAEPVDPPARLRERILAAARADLAQPDTARPPAERPALTAVPRRDAAPLPANVTPIRPGLWSRALPGWLAAAAVLVAAVGLGAWNLQLQKDVDDRDDRLAAQVQTLDAVARSGGLVSNFAPAAQVAGAQGVLVQPERGNPMVLLTGVPQPEGQNVYQLWAIRGGQPQDIGIFRPDEDGRAAVELPDISGAQEVAITVEPRRVPQPTGPKVFGVSLSTASVPRLLLLRQ